MYRPRYVQGRPCCALGARPRPRPAGWRSLLAWTECRAGAAPTQRSESPFSELVSGWAWLRPVRSNSRYWWYLRWDGWVAGASLTPPDRKGIFENGALTLAPPPPTLEIMEHDVVPSARRHDLPVATSQWTVRPPAVLDEP